LRDSREGERVRRGEQAVVLRAFEEINRGDLDAASGYVAPDLALNGEQIGREAYKRRDEAMRAAFPDLRYDIEDLVAEGDTVVARWRMTGTHEGALAGSDHERAAQRQAHRPVGDEPLPHRGRDGHGELGALRHDGVPGAAWACFDRQGSPRRQAPPRTHRPAYSPSAWKGYSAKFFHHPTT
jgi:ketosteroid isomerase-like protein